MLDTKFITSWYTFVYYGIIILLAFSVSIIKVELFPSRYLLVKS